MLHSAPMTRTALFCLFTLGLVACATPLKSPPPTPQTAGEPAIPKPDTTPAEASIEALPSGAPIDLTDGYIHFSTAETVHETCAKYFAGEVGLVLLACESDLMEPLKWEVSRGGALFPHLYRELRIGDVVWSKDLPVGEDGHIFPDLS